MQVLRMQEQVELEEAVQQLIAVASAQPPFTNDFATFSTQRLLQTVVGDDGGGEPSSSATALRTNRPQGWKAGASQKGGGGSDMPATTLLVQRRLNAEYRQQVSEIREEHESRLQGERSRVAEKERVVRTDHADAMKRIAAANASQQDVPLPAMKAPSTVAVEVLEQKLSEQLQRTTTGTTSTESPLPAEGQHAFTAELDASSRKVVTFWKAKYHALVKQLESILVDTAAAEAKCAQQVDLRGASHDTLEQMLTTLRDAEYREKSRTEELRAQYYDACRRHNKQPVEPFVDGLGGDVVYDAKTGRIVTSSDSQRRTSGGMEEDGGQPSEGHRGGGAKQLLETLIREQLHKNREMQRTAVQVEARVRKLMVDYDSALEVFAHNAGQSSGAMQGRGAPGSNGNAHLVEEVISLLAESDRLDNAVHEIELNQLKRNVREAEAEREATEAFETEHITLLRQIEEGREELRKLDVRLMCVSGANTSKVPSGALPATTALEDEATVLASKIALVENEINVIAQERAALMRVNATLDERVQAMLQGREHQVRAAEANKKPTPRLTL